ncbi:hypothetical protein [Caulobacter sp. UNC279MFTsu5.1]|uniref:hypothetical protein n=1 Tax=Caulobacter sp. UNC279MFTsu5.1 TaxID=1502775 RepID=UPI0008E443C4|nr:hypothetical protein [Caulobacter sp. UNC279MFTsu5.1]SFK65713.1 hypothetical protein SAMN02799626_04846 [Caulobacter sp. UNC279MFTsu5.1]
MRSWTWTLLGLALATTPAAAREACPARPPAGAIAMPSTNMQSDLVTLMSLGPAIADKALQRKALLKAKPKCDEPGVETGGATYALFETAAPSPVLMARTADPDAPIFFVAPFADMTTAIMAEIEKRPAPPATASYVLGVSTRTGASALRLYPSVPDNATFKADITAALQGRLPPLVSRDERTKHVQINVQADAYEGPKSTPGATPLPGSGPGLPAVSATPQNDSFRDQPDGGALHPASGFTCPAAIDGFKRDRLTVYDAAQGGRDVSCGYATPSATATLYLTKLPAQYTLTRVFDIYVEQAKAHTPAVSDVADPYPASEGGPRRQGRFWRDKEGRNEGLWLVQIGPWFAKLRVTYRDADAATVRRLAADLLGAIDAQVKPPTA